MSPSSIRDRESVDPFVIDDFTYSEGVYRAFFTASYPWGEQKFVETVDLTDATTGLTGTPSRPLLRLLSLACSLSYYKSTAATQIEVNFETSMAERNFFVKLIRFGLAEYAYRNDFYEKLEPQIDFVGAAVVDADSNRSAEDVMTSPPLVAVGGGKDSVVSIEALKLAGLDPVLFSVNGYAPIDACVAVSGQRYIQARRTLDPALSEVNDRGALNGHVPVTAINSIIGLLLSELALLGPVVMSNESSASSGNLSWRGMEVNHQWSKSAEFEELLRGVLDESGLGGDSYFSLLRSMREIEIAEAFSHFPGYFHAFTSCNRSFLLNKERRASTWCGECPKCEFVFLILAPFVERARLEDIFGKNLLEDRLLLSDYREILGVEGHKPFECVGEYDEAVEAVQLLSKSPDWTSASLVIELSGLATNSSRSSESSGSDDLSHRLPDRYQIALEKVRR